MQRTKKGLNGLDHTDEVLLESLRDALNHLYNPERLHASPLLQIYGASSASQPAARLQQLLLDAIHAMQPPANEPAASVRRRIYNILRLRYEQQFSQKEVAAQLGLSVRQYRRLQQSALEALAFQLSEEFELAVSARIAPQTQAELPDALQWVVKLPHDEITRVDQVLEDVLHLIAPLAQRQEKELVVEHTAPVCSAIHPLVLRQVLVNLLNASILHTAPRTITLRIDEDGRQVQIVIFSSIEAAHTPVHAPLVLPELVMAQTMLRYFGGELNAALMPDRRLVAEVRLPSAVLAPVLVIEDHTDTVALLQRYLVNTSYSVIAVNDPQQAVALAALHQPCAILLDVMMPEMDGWAVLMQLRQDERTASLPVLVCSVLDQSELAMSLGANGFLHKPITRPALLAALNACRAPRV
ncbi:MAG: response regulator [Caldilinea sp.]|jgi:CheY-like chemotaxis protein/transcriptional regulator with XRE-family HTH domain|nr:response regulator [Caldilinea sp.]